LGQLYGPIPSVTPVTLSGVSAYSREAEADSPEALSRTSNEKQVINVTAWKYPTQAKEKLLELWSTTMAADEPSEDFNQLSGKMLAAGELYFDRSTRPEDVHISTK
jgi:hypothetical protein